MDMRNLNFHGLTVSPDAPQEDVLTMMAKPCQSPRDTVLIPKDHPPGLYWYHTHPHGDSHRQVLDGMSGALIIEGIEAYAPGVRTLRERVLLIRELDIEHDPGRSPRRVDHVLLPPAGRVEAIVTAREEGARSVLRTRCVDTGPDGDPNPGMILADIASTDTALAGPPELAR